MENEAPQSTAPNRTHELQGVVLSCLGASCWGNPVIGPDQVLMELKTPGNIPLWMVEFLSRNRIRQTSFSKYGTAYRQMTIDDALDAHKGGLLYA